MAPRKAPPMATLEVRVPVEVAGQLVAYLERHGGSLEGWLHHLVCRRVLELRRIEGSIPMYGSPNPEPPKKKRQPNTRLSVY